MGKSSILARLVAVCAASAVAGGVLAGAPVSAQAPDVASSSIAAPNTAVASPAPVGGDGVTPRGDVVSTGLRIKVVGVTAGGRASVKVTGPSQRSRAARAAKRYSKVIYRTTTLRVRPGVYQVTSAPVSATGGTDVPKVTTKKLRVRKNKLTGFTARYRFVASTLPLASCATGGGASGTCALGDTGPGGGKVFYVNPTPTLGRNYMEAAVSATSPAWTPPDPALAWGTERCYTTYIPGPFGTAIGTGSGNTNAITLACGVVAAPAAWAAKNYTGGGVSWFLPSRDELDALRAQRTTVGGFAAVNYWSSSQYSAGYAWLQNFGHGSQVYRSKLDGVRVRPVRAF